MAKNDPFLTHFTSKKGGFGLFFLKKAFIKRIKMNANEPCRQAKFVG